jgi:phospholipid-translocating ATPase
MDEVAEEIETNLLLMGATAIEDKLQDGVPTCVQLLLDAGIKIWVLTGDKMETAINIGYSCNLLKTEMVLILIRSDSNNSGEELSEIGKQLSDALERFFPTSQTGEAQPPSLSEFALVIDGHALNVVFEKNYIATFMELAKKCASVLCCRVSPLQKACVVELVKKSQKGLCLAIGDGANDVSMIQAAHVGIGIAGEEGRQAVMASDFAIAQFRYLSRLILLHGHWSYRRTAETILNFFFKNIIWV